MFATTDAVVLSLRPYSDKAHILHAYTRAYGRVNYMVYGLGRKHSVGLYTPFTQVQITGEEPSVYMSKPLTLKECVRKRTESHRQCAEGAMYRNAVALFLSEVLYHTLRHPMADEPLYDYIADATERLCTMPTEELANFHLRFLLDFAAYLGFAVDIEKQPQLVRMPSNRAGRQEQLRLLCAYFSDHVETWVEPSSLEVLIEVFD